MSNASFRCPWTQFPDGVIGLISAPDILARYISARTFHHKNISALGNSVSVDISAWKIFGIWICRHMDISDRDISAVDKFKGLVKRFKPHAKLTLT